jgi:sporulation protein YlmC with PRC-barrel domain
VATILRDSEGWLFPFRVDDAACSVFPLRRTLQIVQPRGNGVQLNRLLRISFLIRRNHMLSKYLAAGVAGSMLLASAAYAAETTTTDAASASKVSASESSFQGDWRASKVVGLNVYNDQNENVGSINDLLMDKAGSIKAAVISVGGFLGMGSKYVALPYDKIKFSNDPVSYTGVSGAANTGGAKPPMSSTSTTGSTANPPAGAATAKANPWYPDHALVNATKDELKNMAEFKYSE